MRAVVQRVDRASVRVEGEVVGAMGPGLLALVGVAHDDVAADAEELARKLVGLRVFEDDAGLMNRSLLDSGLELGVVSQFTLLGDCRKGRRPSFGEAARPEPAAPPGAAGGSGGRGHGGRVVSGRVGAMTSVELVNAGPVTLLLDTRKAF